MKLVRWIASCFHAAVRSKPGGSLRLQESQQFLSRSEAEPVCFMGAALNPWSEFMTKNTLQAGTEVADKGAPGSHCAHWAVVKMFSIFL